MRISPVFHWLQIGAPHRTLTEASLNAFVKMHNDSENVPPHTELRPRGRRGRSLISLTCARVIRQVLTTHTNKANQPARCMSWRHLLFYRTRIGVDYLSLSLHLHDKYNMPFVLRPAHDYRPTITEYLNIISTP